MLENNEPIWDLWQILSPERSPATHERRQNAQMQSVHWGRQKLKPFPIIRCRFAWESAKVKSDKEKAAQDDTQHLIWRARRMVSII